MPEVKAAASALAAPPRDPWHWLRHRWGPWRAGRQTVRGERLSGVTIGPDGLWFRTGAPAEIERAIQYRRCLTCGRLQVRRIPTP